MATLTITLVVGTQTSTETITFNNGRGFELLDDMRQRHFIQDPVMTRAEVGDHFVKQAVAGYVAWSKALKQPRLDEAKAIADDLQGN